MYAGEGLTFNNFFEDFLTKKFKENLKEKDPVIILRTKRHHSHGHH